MGARVKHLLPVKRCSSCHEYKGASNFYRSSACGVQNRCIPCVKQRDKARPSRANDPRRADNYFRRTYGITAAEKAEMLERQGGVCAICAVVPKRAVVDHDHESGAIRGILCDICNRALGLLKDSVEVLNSAAEYLIAAADAGGSTKAGESNG